MDYVGEDRRTRVRRAVDREDGPGDRRSNPERRVNSGVFQGTDRRVGTERRVGPKDRRVGSDRRAPVSPG